MDAFQRLRGLVTVDEATKRIEALEAEILRLERQLARTENAPQCP
jgi:uncharacterized small protein (DUF1192 family)